MVLPETADVRILTFCDYFLPGFKAGGPITTLRSLGHRLPKGYRLRIVTRDRDLGDRTPYPGVPKGQWTRVDGLDVYYMDGRRRHFGREVARLLRSEAPDIVYLNSFHSPRFSLCPLLAARVLSPEPPVVLAPRGEFAPAALERKKTQKRVLRNALGAAGLLDRITFQASTELEARDIHAALGESVTVLVAPDLPGAERVPPSQRAEKRPGQARIVFLGRISPMKNICWLVELLSDFDRELDLRIVGPPEDAEYRKRCERAAARVSDRVTVRFMGEMPRDAVGRMLSEADALVLPSLGENFGHVVPEALCAGCPVIVSAQTPWEGVQQAGCGWCLALEPEIWRRILRLVADLDEPPHAAFRAAAREFGASHAADPAALEANVRLFDSVVGRTHVHRGRTAPSGGQ